jgi:multidrug efflux system membrane fusion protein
MTDASVTPRTSCSAYAMRIAIPFLFVPALVLAIAGCEREAPVREERPRPVRAMVVESSRTDLTFTLPGEVRPRVETRYGFRVGGKIAERMVSVGDTVAAGQTLARLDPKDVAPAIAEAQAQLAAVSTDLKLARIELERLKDLHGQNFVSQAQVDRQQAQTDATSARRRTAEAQLNQARNAAAFQELVADTDGVVTAIEAEAGQVVSAGQPVVRVARTDEKELLVNVPEADLPTARTTQSWLVTFNALGKLQLPAELRELSPVADPASRTYPMRLRLGGDSSAVALGMTATVTAIRQSNESIVLPMSALHSTDGSAQVWVVNDDMTVHRVPVQTEGLLDEAVRISSGLQPGDRVVTAGANLLVPGQKVRLLDEAVGIGGNAKGPDRVPAQADATPQQTGSSPDQDKDGRGEAGQ